MSIKRKILNSVASRKVVYNIQNFFYKNDGYENKELLEQYQKDGIVVLPKFFSQEDCQKIIAILEDSISKEKENKLEKNIKTIKNTQVYNNGKRVIYSFSYPKDFEDIYKIVENPELKSICEYLNRSKLIEMQHWIKRVYAVAENKEKRLMNESWHQDSGGLSMIRFIVYLRDIDEKQGPFQYILGSHTKNIKNPSVYITKNPDKKFIVKGKAGDVVIADVTSGWHRAGIVSQGERDTLQVAYTTKFSDTINKIFNFGSYLNTYGDK